MPVLLLFFFTDTATTEIYTLSLHDALPISLIASLGDLISSSARIGAHIRGSGSFAPGVGASRSEEHTSELQSRENLVCRLLLEKKKKKRTRTHNKKEKTMTTKPKTTPTYF